MAKVISDHIMMISRANGSKKAVPCWQIRGWIAKGQFDPETEKGNPVGYDFADHRAGVADYEKWATEQKRLVMIRRSAAGPQLRDGGIADAQFHPHTAPQAPAAFEDAPPPVASGTESVSKGPEFGGGDEPPAEPEDVI